MSKSKHTDYDYLFKIVIVGNPGVGKSCIMTQFVDKMFYDSYISTIGIDFKVTTINIGNKRVKLQLWDTAGQERFRTITNSYYRSAHGVVIVYSVTDRSSFDQVQSWIANAIQQSQDNVPMLILGNKTDLESSRQVSTAEGQKFADMHNILFAEVSAKASNNIATGFHLLTDQMISKYGDIFAQEKKNLDKENNKKVNLDIKVQKTSCCK